MTLRFFMLEPEIIFAARVNMASVTYPIDVLTFDGVTTGAFGDIEPGMTLLLGSSAAADNYGRQRVRSAASATVIPIGRSSLGYHDGELNVQDDAYITILNDYRVWSRVPYIDSDGNMFKDSSLEVGTNTTQPPPVANAGPPAAGTIDSVTSKLQVMLPPYSPNRSFATADGESISTYAWVLPTGVTLAGGYALSDSQIVVDCDPGFYWIKLTVTDSNGKSHTTNTFVYARDESDDDTISASEIVSHRITRHGQVLDVRVSEDISAYVDGTLCLFMDGEPESLSVRRNMLFWGWHQTDPAEIRAGREATLSSTIIRCVDIAGRLDNLGGMTQVVYNDSKRIASENDAITWAYMTIPNWDKLLHYLLAWHSTALELTDWQWTGVGSSFPFTVREAGGASLFDQVNRQCESLCPPHYFTCDREGLLACPVDPMLQDAGDRTSTIQETIPVSNWSQVRYTHQRPPRIHWLDDSAIVANADVVNAIFSHAPGDAPGQGESRSTHGEQISPDQTTLNATCGHRYARLNAGEGPWTIEIAQSQDSLVDPAAMEWTRLSVSAAVAAERGLAFSEERGLVNEMTIRYVHDKRGQYRIITLLWERELVGTPGVTVPPPEIEDAGGNEEDDWVPPDLDDDAFTGNPQAYVMWNLYRVFRTADILAASPTWELIDTGIYDGSREIYDLQYITTSATTIGCYAMTSTGVFYCENILATTPSWSSILSNATIQSAEAQPVVGNTIAISMATWGIDPEFIVVATGYDATAENSSSNWNTKIAYMWHSHDNGQTWTTANLSAFTRTYTSYERGFGLVDLYSCAMYRDANAKIYCARAVQVIGLNEHTKVFVSDDQGHSWELAEPQYYEHYNQPERMALHHPYPDITSPCWFVGGQVIGVTNRPKLYESTNEFDNAIIRAEANSPAGYGGCAPSFKPNTDPFDANHIIIWMRDNTGSPYEWDLMKWNGVSWSAIWEPGDADVNVQMPLSQVATCPWSTPNGWPADSDKWFSIGLEPGVTTTTDRIIYTDDEFSTTDDKEGNLNTILGGDNWDGGQGGGFVLPRIGTNS